MLKQSVTVKSLFGLLFLCVLVVGEGFAANLPDFTSLVKSAGPSVVNISTKQLHKQNRMPRYEFPQGPGGDMGPFKDFFEHFFGEGGPPRGPEESFSTQSLGSGFIVSEDGYILTNHHVVVDADEIIVRLSDRREFIAELVGSDARSDVAVLKVKADDLPAVKLGKPDELSVGEWVLAIGSPFGFDHSVTAGIVSAIGRSLPNDTYVPFIQTDVAINPGNSGGPLFNLEGEVVGINSQIYSRTGGFMGLSFAIPIDVALEVTEQLKSSGHVTRGWLGVLIQDVTLELAESFGMKQPSGALVAKVLPGSPAEEAGIQVGDIILSYGDSEVTYSRDLPPIVGRSTVGSKVGVNVLRNGKRVKLGVTLAALPEDESNLPRLAKSSSEETNRLGIFVIDVPAELRQKIGLGSAGVMVKKVAEGVARDAGVREGDVIVSINNEAVSNAKSFNETVDGLPSGKAVPVLLQRRQGPVFLALRIPAENS